MKHFLKILPLFLPFFTYAQTTLPPETPIQSVAVKTWHVEGYPDFIAPDSTGVWITNKDRVEKMTWPDSRPVLSIDIPNPCGVMRAAYGSLWVASCDKKSLFRLNGSNGKIQAVISTGLADPDGELSIAAGDESVWVASSDAGELSRINILTNRVIAKIRIAPHSFAAAFGYGSIWVTNSSDAAVERIDPKTNSVKAKIKTGNAPRFLTAGLGGVWVLNQDDGTVTFINPSTNAPATIFTDVKGSGGDIAVGSKYVYVRAKKTLLTVIDPISKKVIRRYGPPAGSGAVCVENGRVWMTAHDINTIWTWRE
jgi:virginiamycin B lyase